MNETTVAPPRETTGVSCATFLTGLLSAQVIRGRAVFDLTRTRFDEAVRAAYVAFEQQAPKRGLEPRFAVYLHPIYGDSGDVRAELVAAMSRGLLTVDAPGWETGRATFGKDTAEMIVEGLPGDRRMWLKLAAVAWP